MTRLDAILMSLALAVGVGGALYSMHQYSVYASSMAAREVRRQASLAMCEENGAGYLEQDDSGQWWCTLAPLGSDK